jgi:D-3-phosphoglycerate dehydrogenase / 2-oxoglutarate reductase
VKVVLLENIHPVAAEAFGRAGFEVDARPGSLGEHELCDVLQGVSLLGIRSNTTVTPRVLEAAKDLLAVGCFCIGTNQVDLADAAERGVAVFNAPFSNTRSVVELVLAEIIALARRLPEKTQRMHDGVWDKSAKGSHEVRGRTLGIVGYGNIGTQLAVIAEAMGMRVIYYDHTDKLRHGNVEPADSLDELLAKADIVTMHVPETPATQGMIGAREIAQMKKGAIFINNARGSLVDLEALAAALKSNHLSGAAVDVFPIEPSSNTEKFANPLQGLDNVILTPHVGGSTEEAQERIGAEVARKFVEYSDVGSTTGAVNFPQVQLPPRPAGTRFIQVQRNLPGELGRLNEVFAHHKVNIAAQHYQTDGELGYVVLDADGQVPDAEDIVREIRGLSGTIRARMLYRRS